jgi:hypothetical protein
MAFEQRKIERAHEQREEKHRRERPIGRALP